MKKIIILGCLFCLFLTGCGRVSDKDIVNDLNKKINKNSSYKASGELSVNNNDEVYEYDIEALYDKGNYKVSLTNKSNDHTQIILKNNNAVYVLTPSLNKSFRFQSDWPYNNSQIYLLDALVKDINNDNKKTFSVDDDKYVFKTKVKYPNNSKLVNQKIVIGKDKLFEKVIVYDKDGVAMMTMKFDKIKYNPKISSDEFKIDNIIKDEEVEDKPTGSFDDTIYPLFVPNGTKLVEENSIKKDNGKRVIMNYDGEKSFTLVEEDADVFNEFTIIPTMGEPCLLMDSLGVMADKSLSWTSGGVDFYLVSDVLNQMELVEVAQSISGIVSMK